MKHEKWKVTKNGERPETELQSGDWMSQKAQQPSLAAETVWPQRGKGN